MVVIAADCGGTNLSVGRIDRATDRFASIVVDTPQDVTEIPGAIAALAAGLGDGIDGAGVAIAGLVQRGDLVWMPHRDGGTSIAGPLSAALGVPVEVDNDANLAALAEATEGAGAGHRMVLMVTVGTGIGGGLVIEGRIERGRGFLGEIGHTTLDLGGPTCSCGKPGCWEAFASGTALDRTAVAIATADPNGAVARSAAGSEASGRDLVDAARAGDPAATEAFGDFATHFGRGLANMIAVFDPDVIVVGGGVGSIGEPLLAPARAAMEDWVTGAEHRAPTPVVAAHFGPRAGIVGAALAAGAPA